MRQKTPLLAVDILPQTTDRAEAGSSMASMRVETEEPTSGCWK